MSSILKALRKLEEEKSVRQEGEVDIARDILRIPRRSRPGRRKWLLPLGGGLFVVSAAVAVTLFLSRGGDDLPSGTLVQAPESVSGEAAPSPAVVLPPPPVKPSVTASPRSARPLSRLPGEKVIVEETIDNPPIPSHTAAVRGGDKRVAPSPHSVVAELSRPSVPPASPHPVVPAPAKGAEAPFVLSGIVHQGDPEGRVAVVNDLPVMTGTVIEGATVREILPDRVRLELPNGRALDLFLEP